METNVKLTVVLAVLLTIFSFFVLGLWDFAYPADDIHWQGLTLDIYKADEAFLLGISYARGSVHGQLGLPAETEGQCRGKVDCSRFPIVCGFVFDFYLDGYREGLAKRPSRIQPKPLPKTEY